MRILAIRGANLASLEGEFALELARAPLAHAGVFPICGPTGAGKSTLLDAMCLALFDSAPRLGGRVKIGRADEEESQRITTGDPRSVLRKGAGEAYAEVDFLGRDGRPYRARWEVRRARGRASGRLQFATMRLVDLEDGRELGDGRKTDVLAAIEERLGLTFDQFRRSVLLAQNDFAAFLDADAKERAGLLERMTGTEIYGAISREAHVRAGEERRALSALEEHERRMAVPSSSEREEHEQRLRELERLVSDDEAHAREAERALAWHALLEGLRREESEAREDHERTREELALAETRRAELEAYEAARPLLPLLEAADRASALRETRALELARVTEERIGRERLREEAEAAEHAAREEARAAEEARAEVRPVLTQARRLDAEREAARQRVAERERRLDDARARLEADEARRAPLEAALEAQRERASAAAAWLAEHADWGPVAQDWPRLEPRLERLGERSAALLEAERELVEAERRRGEAAARRDERAAAAAEAAKAAAAAEGSWSSAAGRARAAPSDALSEVRARWMERRSVLDTMLGVVGNAERALDAERRQREAAARAVDRVARAEAELARAARERSGVELQLAEAQRARDALRSTLDLSSRRAELREGEPCPLCGALEHPFTRELPLVEGLLSEQDARVAALTAEVRLLERLGAEATSDARAGEAARSEAEREGARWTQEREEARRRYAQAAAALGGHEASGPHEPPWTSPPQADWGSLFGAAGGEADGPLLDPQALRALERAVEAAVDTLRQLDAEERVRREAEREVEVLRVAYDADRARADAAAQEAQRAADAGAALAEEAARLERAVAEVRARVREEVETLAAALGEARRSRLELEPGPLATELRAGVEAWRTRRDEQREAEEAVRGSEPSLVALREQTLVAKRQLASAHEELEEALGALARASAARAEVLDGQDADAHERSVDARVAQARDAASRLSAESGAARTSAVEWGAREEAAREAWGDAGHEERASSERLARACEAVGLEVSEVRRWLGRDPEEFERARRERNALIERRERQWAVLEERARRREAHEEEGAPALGPDDTRHALTEARRRVASSREQSSAASAWLARDDAQRAELATLHEQLRAARERLGLWDTLSKLIGSADGARFRLFAQSLTLERLLEHANHHLGQLAPRYALARVPGEDLALMVKDRDMADEVRSVGSLSGGESFLVALGMALGLSTLGSHRASIGSLFIDEGFGSLDPASLEVVLGALDALQASGRQIGLISHVQAMVERFDTRVEVVTVAPGRSRVTVAEGFG